MLTNQKNHSVEDQLHCYFNAANAVLLKSIDPIKSILPVGVTMFGALNAMDAQIVYSGVQNINVVIPNNLNSVTIDLNGGGGDLKISNNTLGVGIFIQVNEVAGSNFAITGFVANNVAGYVYPYAKDPGFVVGAAGPWNLNGAANDANTLADSAAPGAYPNDHWETDGMTKFLCFKGNIAGSNKYGWLRLTRNSLTNWTVVDWAYNSIGNSIITGDVLPIELINFKAKSFDDFVSLNWATASEVNNKGWNLERSNDALNWSSIAWIDGKGDSKNNQNYDFKDYNPLPGMNYYRLHQIDFDGTETYSEIEAVKHEFKYKSIYPNPVTERIQLEGFSVGKYKVLNNLGQEIQIGNVDGNSIDVSLLPEGTYFLEIDDNTGKSRHLIIKSNQ